MDINIKMKKFKIKNINDLLFLRGRPFHNEGFGWGLSDYIKYSIVEPHGCEPKITEYSGSDHVFCYTLNFYWLYDRVLDGTIKTTDKSILLLGGHDVSSFGDWTKPDPHSPKSIARFAKCMKKLHKYFSEIYFEGENGSLSPRVEPLPNNLCLKYFENTSHSNILNTINKQQHKKKWLVGAPTGIYTGDNETEERRNLAKEVSNPSSLIKRIETSPSEWWDTISKYKFICSPAGVGMQCSKTYEAFLTDTVPIVRGHPQNVRLKEKYNLPMLLIDSWEELTTELLEETYNSYSVQDWNRARKLLTAKGFAKAVLGS